MKTLTKPITCCIVAIALAGCADRVAAPARPAIAGQSEKAPSLAAAASNGATRESGIALFVNDYSEYFDCLGEMVHMHMEVPYRWAVTTTPSGNVVDVEPLLQGDGTGQAEGLTSGRVWTAKHFVGPLKTIAAGAEAGSFVLTINWAGGMGPNWALHDTYHATITPSGEVTTQRFVSRCVLHGNGA